MFRKTLIATAVTSMVALSAHAGFGLKDLKPSSFDKCENAADKAKCNRETLGRMAIDVGALSIAAKMVYELLIDFKTREVGSADDVKAEYLKDNKKLPKKATILAYTTSIDPNKVVQLGKPTTVKSEVKVVPGRKDKKVSIEEKIVFFDNEDHTKVIRTLVKPVNEKTGQAGAFENSFTFTLPKGMPQGVYKIKTAVIVDGNESDPIDNEMQVVMHVLPQGHVEFVALAQ